MLLAFDTPIPFSTVGRRQVSNVPAQALILMNDPFVHEQAGGWAERVLGEIRQSTDERVIRTMYRERVRPAADSRGDDGRAREFVERTGREVPKRRPSMTHGRGPTSPTCCST